jgi:signal transduction histidine kinase
LALARQGDERQRTEMLDRIEQDTIQLDSMLERILAVARLESGQHKPHFEQVSLNELVDDVVQDARFEAAATNATISYEGPGCDIRMNGDPGLLRSAIENVIRNAIFYSGQGGTIDVHLHTLDDAAILSVRDNGPGVPDDKLGLIFEPFYRVDDARGTTTGGMGLGLAIVRRATSAHHGSIVAYNLKPHGLEITLRLPMLPNPAGARSSGVHRAIQPVSKPQ